MKAILVLSGLLLASCLTSGGINQNRLVGKWRSTGERHTAEYLFLGNGTFSGSVSSGAAVVSQFVGKWSVSGDSILYEYVRDIKGTIPAGTKDRDTLVAVAKDHYIIEAADGSRRKYVRISAIPAREKVL